LKNAFSLKETIILQTSSEEKEALFLYNPEKEEIEDFAINSVEEPHRISDIVY
jgi:hypothetical protein